MNPQLIHQDLAAGPLIIRRRARSSGHGSAVQLSFHSMVPLTIMMRGDSGLGNAGRSRRR
jgi:hypothetical protein